MLPVLCLSLSLLAPGTDAQERCKPGLLVQMYNDGRYSELEDAALTCASASEPRYYFFAAQAQEKQRKWKRLCGARATGSLQIFLEHANETNPYRKDAEDMLQACQDVLKKQEAARLAAKAAKKDDPPPKVTSAEEERKDEPLVPLPPKPGAVAPEDATDDPNNDVQTAPTAREEVVHGSGAGKEQGPKIGNKEPPPMNVVAETKPRSLRLWLGLGLGAGVTALAGMATGLVGRLAVTDLARERDEKLLAQHGVVRGQLQPQTCPNGPQCAEASAVDAEYPAAQYHKDLIRGLQLESAGTALGGTSLGLVVGGVPGLVRAERGRRIGLGLTIGVGVASLVGGAVLASRVKPDLQEQFNGYDSQKHPENWRVGGDELVELRRNYLLGVGLAGLGAGLAVGSTITMAILGRHGKSPGTSARVQVRPFLSGLMLFGKF